MSKFKYTKTFLTSTLAGIDFAHACEAVSCKNDFTANGLHKDQPQALELINQFDYFNEPNHCRY